MRRLNNKNCRVRMQEESRIVAVVPERQRRSSNNGDDCGGLEISQYIICSLSNPARQPPYSCLPDGYKRLCHRRKHMAASRNTKATDSLLGPLPMFIFRAGRRRLWFVIACAAVLVHQFTLFLRTVICIRVIIGQIAGYFRAIDRIDPGDSIGPVHCSVRMRWSHTGSC